jgi:pimeloyl-ACP methyl ester carboxylesterase
VDAVTAAGAVTRADGAGSIRRRYVETSFGQLHLAEAGAGEHVLFLHQTPRSWTEFIHVLPVVGRQAHAMAMDTLGFGQSAPTSVASIERFAAAVNEVLEVLGLDRVTLVGHHTGAVIALEAATTNPDRFSSLVLSAMPLVTPERRERARNRPSVDHVETSADGSHLAELWQRRRSFYAAGQEADLTRFVVDALQVDDVDDGHHAVNDYEMPAALPRVRTRVLLLCGADDPYSLPDQAALAEILQCELMVIDNAGVCLPEQRPVEFSQAVLSFALRPASSRLLQ